MAALRDAEDVPETVAGDGLQHQRRRSQQHQRSRLGMTEAISHHISEIRRLTRRLLLMEQSAPAVRTSRDAAIQTDPPPPFDGRSMRIFRPPYGSSRPERRAYSDGVGDAFEYLSPGEIPLVGQPYSSYEEEEEHNMRYEAEASARRSGPQ